MPGEPSRTFDRTRRTYWPALTIEAMQPDILPRVFAAIRFDQHCGTTARGSIAWWRPAYVHVPAELFARYGEHAATHLANRRSDVGHLNRSLRDSPVHLLAMSDRIVLVDEFAGEGEWRTDNGASRGSMLPASDGLGRIPAAYWPALAALSATEVAGFFATKRIRNLANGSVVLFWFSSSTARWIA